MRMGDIGEPEGPEREQHVSADLRRQAKAADALVEGTNQITQDVLTACANFSANIIKSAVKDTTDLAAELYDSSDKAANFLLTHTEKTLEKQRKLVGQERAKLEQLNELALNPDGEKAQAARGMAVERKAALQQKRTEMRVDEAEVMREVEKRADDLVARAQQEWAERRREVEEKKIMDAYSAQQMEELKHEKAQEFAEHQRVKELDKQAFVERVKEVIRADQQQRHYGEDAIANLTFIQARSYTREARMAAKEGVQRARRQCAQKDQRPQAEIDAIPLPEWPDAKKFLQGIARDANNTTHPRAQQQLRLAGEVW